MILDPLALQGRFRFPGIVGVLSASYAYRRGISPSLAQVEIAPNPMLQKYGTMQWIYGTTDITFPNSVVENVKVTRPGGNTVWLVTIADRRAYWRYGYISGVYNAKIKGQTLPSREKTPQELATLLLEAMGEVGFVVADLPDDARPPVEWDMANPAKELADLCESLGCVVVLGLDDLVRLQRFGEGLPLPPDYMSLETEFDPAVTPSQITFVAAPTRWQVDLKLEPVGIEESGQIVPIDELTYMPIAGWATEDPVDFLGVVNEERRKLAKKWIWRSYRVVLSPPLTLYDPETPVEDIADLQRILPLVPEQVETEGIDEDEKSKEAIVWGRFYDAHGGGQTNVEEILDELPRTKLKLIYEGSIQIDAELGIVKFSEPIFLLDTDIVARVGYEPAEIFLRCSVNGREPDTLALYRRTLSINGDVLSPSEPEYVVREDIERLIYKDDVTLLQVDNVTEVDEAGEYYIQETIRRYIPQQSASALYAGFIPIQLDGSIASVTWKIQRDKHAITEAALSVERGMDAPSYGERRDQEKLKAALKDRDTAKQKKNRRGRRSK